MKAHRISGASDAVNISAQEYRQDSNVLVAVS